MVYSVLMYYFRRFITKLSENQRFIQFTHIAPKWHAFEPYFGNHEIRNSLNTKNMQKKFFKVAPPSPDGTWGPLAPLANY